MSLRVIDPEELRSILEKHKKWLEDEEGGERANLSYSNLRGSDLSYSDLRGSNLRGSDLRNSDLRNSDLRNSDLRGSDLDFSAWPLWCGSNHVKVDAKIARQLAAHFCALDCEDEEYQEARKAILVFAAKSHRASDLGIEAPE